MATTADEAIRATIVGHATVLIEFDAVRVLTDPFLGRRLGPLERHGPLPDVDTLPDVDVVVDLRTVITIIRSGMATLDTQVIHG